MFPWSCRLPLQGFRKVVPTRWEFGNDYFKKGEFDLLCEIQRRKAFLPSSQSSQVSCFYRYLRQSVRTIVYSPLLLLWHI